MARRSFSSRCQGGSRRWEPQSNPGIQGNHWPNLFGLLQSDGMLGFAGSSLDGKGEVKAFRIDNGEDALEGRDA